jgi:hypothetical protein
VRLWVLVGVLAGAVVAAVALYFLPEQETVITRGLLGDEIRRMAEFAPMADDLKDLKELKK